MQVRREVTRETQEVEILNLGLAPNEQATLRRILAFYERNKYNSDRDYDFISFRDGVKEAMRK